MALIVLNSQKTRHKRVDGRPSARKSILNLACALSFYDSTILVNNQEFTYQVHVGGGDRKFRFHPQTSTSDVQHYP